MYTTAQILHFFCASEQIKYKKEDVNKPVNSFEEVFEAVKEYCTKDGKVGDIARNLWLDTLKPARLEGTDAVFYCASDFQRSVVNACLLQLHQQRLPLNVRRTQVRGAKAQIQRASPGSNGMSSSLRKE